MDTNRTHLTVRGQLQMMKVHSQLSVAIVRDWRSLITWSNGRFHRIFKWQRTCESVETVVSRSNISSEISLRIFSLQINLQNWLLDILNDTSLFAMLTVSIIFFLTENVLVAMIFKRKMLSVISSERIYSFLWIGPSRQVKNSLSKCMLTLIFPGFTYLNTNAAEIGADLFASLFETSLKLQLNDGSGIINSPIVDSMEWIHAQRSYFIRLIADILCKNKTNNCNLRLRSMKLCLLHKALYTHSNFLMGQIILHQLANVGIVLKTLWKPKMIDSKDDRKRMFTFLYIVTAWWVSCFTPWPRS